MNEPRFEVFPEKWQLAVHGVAREGEFFWHFRAANGKIDAVGGEGFTRREDARRAIQQFTADVGVTEMPAEIVDLDENGDRIEAAHPIDKPDAE